MRCSWSLMMAHSQGRHGAIGVLLYETNSDIDHQVPPAPPLTPDLSAEGSLEF